MEFAVVLSALSLFVWVYLLAFHGGFWRADQRLAATLPEPDTWPEVVVLVPARNEVEMVGRSIACHMASAYPGRLSVILVDDQSDDGTADAALEAAKGAPRPFSITSAPPVASGWTGKLWALKHGLMAAREKAPDATYVWLTDADIVHGQDVLARLVSKAEHDGLALVSVMALLDSKGFWAGLLMPAFVFFFQKLYPFPLVNELSSGVSGAAGGCILVRRDALDAMGGFAAIRNQLIDDCAIARKIKLGPPRRPIWLGLSQSVHSLRDNSRLKDTWHMVSRTAFAQLHYSLLLLVGMIMAMTLLYLVPPVFVVTWPWHHDAILGGVGFLTWSLMVIAYGPTLRLYGRHLAHGLLLPVAALLYCAMTMSSAVRQWRGHGGKWKGRVYPAPERRSS